MQTLFLVETHFDFLSFDWNGRVMCEYNEEEWIYSEEDM